MNFKRKLSLLILFFMSVAVFAQKQMILKTIEGDFGFLIKDCPSMYYKYDTLTIYIDKEINSYEECDIIKEISIPISKVKKIFFEDINDSGIKNLGKRQQIFFDNGVLKIFNMNPFEKVFIYNLEGQKNKESMTSMTGDANIDLGDIPKGLYIVNTRELSIKILKK